MFLIVSQTIPSSFYLEYDYVFSAFCLLKSKSRYIVLHKYFYIYKSIEDLTCSDIFWRDIRFMPIISFLFMQE